jgi:hypothetical protein
MDEDGGFYGRDRVRGSYQAWICLGACLRSKKWMSS